jgi:alkylation response protein AidB-like acyl-CoA dehydrogenase
MDLSRLKNFNLDDTQKEVRAQVEHFAQTRILPHVEKYESEARYPRELLKEIADRGYFGVLVPKDWGGMGLDFVSYSIIVEELARVDRVCASIVHVQNSLLCFGLLKFGTDFQKKKYLRQLARGEIFSSACFTEEHIGTDLPHVQTQARRDGDDYVINGRKMYISHAEVANLFFVLASLNPDQGSKATVAFLVDANLPGIEIKKIPMRTMKRGSICAVSFSDVRVPTTHRVLEEGEGLKISNANLDIGRYSVASQALGQAQASLDIALFWSKERMQFGRPIGKFQMIQQKLADMIAAVDAARLLTYRVGHLKNDGMERVSMEAAIAKYVASETATRVALDAIQILGARGLSEEYAVSRIPLEAKVLEIAEGSNEIHRILIAEYALGFRSM